MTQLRTQRARESLRQSFRPSRVRLLFIGEAPPVSGRFFYAGDSGLYRAMRMAFQVVDPGLRDEDFLAAFRSRGCYLTDLCGEPVDHLESALRRTMCGDGEKSLAREIRRLQPEIIAPLLRSIADNVDRAVTRAGWQGKVVSLPYPGRWSRHRDAFIEAVVPLLRALGPGI